MPHAITTTTIVRIAVARLEFTPSMPIFAKIEVSAAKTADRDARMNHIQYYLRSFFQKVNDSSLHHLNDVFNRQANLLLIRNRRCAIAVLLSVHTEVSMATAVNDHLGIVVGQIGLVFVIFLTIHHLILAAVNRKHVKIGLG